MNTQIFLDIRNSKVVKIYFFFLKFSKIIETIKWVIGLTFLISIFLLFTESKKSVGEPLLIISFNVGLIILMIRSLFKKTLKEEISDLSYKYSIQEKDIKKIIHEIYENKN